MKLQQSFPLLSRQTLIVHIKHPNPHIHCNISHLLLFYTFFQFQYEFLRDARFLIQQLNVNVILDFGDKILLQFTPTDNCWSGTFMIQPIYCTLSLLSTLVNFEKLCCHMLGRRWVFRQQKKHSLPSAISMFVAEQEVVKSKCFFLSLWSRGTGETMNKQTKGTVRGCSVQCSHVMSSQPIQVPIWKHYFGLCHGVSESFRSKSFAVFQSPLDFVVSTWESHYKSTVTGRCLKRRLYLIFLHLYNFWLNFFHAKARKSRQNRLRKKYRKLP